MSLQKYSTNVQNLGHLNLFSHGDVFHWSVAHEHSIFTVPKTSMIYTFGFWDWQITWKQT